MRIFVCEHITGGGFHSEPLPPSLLREGAMMLTALLRDLVALPGVDIVASRDPRVAEAELAPESGPIRWSVAESAGDVWPSWQRCVADAAAVWLIAPETGGELQRFAEMVVEHRRILLGSTIEAIHITASKKETARILAENGIPVVPTYPARAAVPAAAHGWVVKPDDGAGAEDTWLFRDAAEMRRWLREETRADSHVIQPYLEGRAASLSGLALDGEVRVLTCNTQDIVVEQSRFRYRGGVVGGLEKRRSALTPIADAVAKAIPGLWGYVGIDLVDTDEGPVVLEVNPRLTTSYVGLATAIGTNPAGLVLDLLKAGTGLTAEPESVIPVPVRINDGPGASRV